MARVKEEEIERMKTEVDLVSLIRSKGIDLKPHGGKDLVGLSPFTDEKEPSFIVTPDKNLWHCMSSGKGGSVIDFVMHYQKVSFRHAFELLNESHGELFLKPSKRGEIRKQRRLPSPISFDADEQTLIAETLDYYQERLKSPAGQGAVDYLKKRGLWHEEALKTFKIGLSDRTLGLRLPHANCEDGIQIRQKLKRIGLLRAETGHEHFNGCIVFPVMDAEGNVSEIYGRRFGKQKSNIYHMYLPGPHVGIWNPQCFENREIILTESIIDALTFWVHGFKNVTCIYGTEGFSDDLFEAFVKHKTHIVRFAYDNDKAGNRSAQRDAERLSAIGIDCYRVKFPADHDVNSYALTMTPAAKSLRVLLQSAQWIGKGQKSCIQNNGTKVLLAANNGNCEKVLEVEEPKPEANAKADEVAAKDKMAEAPKLTKSNDDYHWVLGDREYRVRGLHKNNSLEVLKINLRLRFGDLFHLDELNLYHAKQREAFIRYAASETTLKPELIKRDMGKLLLALEQRQEERMAEALKPQEDLLVMDESDQQTALELLRSPRLLERILSDFDACGIVGEATNKLTGYIASVSRKLNKPLAVIVQSTSAAGKTTLMESVLSFLPEEEQIKYSAMTGQSLYYLGEANLKHKVLAIVEEEGAEKASYALKLLQSEGELTIASTGKDENGRMKTEEYHVEGPVMIFLTTTAIDIDEELLNRCLVLSVDESREQTESIHRLQRKRRTKEGMALKRVREKILKVHRNAQRLLKPMDVVNPFADQLTFRSDRTRMRRDHEKYLTLIDTIALLHQHQRQVKTLHGQPYIEVELSDIEAANNLSHEVLGRSLDELSPQTRCLLVMIKAMVEAECETRKMDIGDYRFSRRDVRRYTGWTEFQVRTHLNKLQEMEYLLVHFGGRGQSFVYELLFDGEESSRLQLNGLLDVAKLKTTIRTSSIENGSSSPQRASNEPGSRNGKSALLLDKNRGLNGRGLADGKNAQAEPQKNGAVVVSPSSGTEA